MTTPDDPTAFVIPPDADGILAVVMCSKCGEPMPPMPQEMADLARSRGFTVSHDQCPRDPVPPPAGRYFEVRTSIVEIIERDEATVEAVEFFRFTDAVRAGDLDSAMRPLAEKLGIAWEKAEKSARIADADGGAL